MPDTLAFLQVKTIETPAYTELTDDDLRERLALLEACRLKDQRKGKAPRDTTEALDKSPAVPEQAETFGGSSSEDTSDEKYTRLHSVEEEKERALESEFRTLPLQQNKKIIWDLHFITH